MQQPVHHSSENGIHRIILNRPKQLNSFTTAMHEGVNAALDALEADNRARVLLITGTGKAFCAGQDLAERDTKAGPLDLSVGPDKYYNPLMRRLAGAKVPVVCGVNGVAAGAGVNIAIGCDIVIAKHSAKFMQAFSKIGLVPDAGGTWVLPRLVGQARALGFTLLSGTLSAQEAERMGLIWQAVADEDYEDKLEQVLNQLAAAPTFGLVQARNLIKSATNSGFQKRWMPNATRKSCAVSRRIIAKALRLLRRSVHLILMETVRNRGCK